MHASPGRRLENWFGRVVHNCFPLHMTRPLVQCVQQSFNHAFWNSYKNNQPRLVKTCPWRSLKLNCHSVWLLCKHTRLYMVNKVVATHAGVAARVPSWRTKSKLIEKSFANMSTNYSTKQSMLCKYPTNAGCSVEP